MNSSIIETSKVFDAKVRVQMVASLSVGDLTFSQLKEICQCSTGNMTTHIKKLVEEDFITVNKEFKNNRPCTTYHLTQKGKQAFENYVESLNYFLQKEKEQNELSMSENIVKA